ncbi:MAG: hypothetical protein C4329_12080 [Chitinophagaceae bacterium]
MASLLSVDLIWLLFGIFVLCFLGILLIQTEDRFWLPCIIIWVFLFFALVLGNSLNSSEVSYQQLLQQQGITKTTDPKEIETAAVKQAKQQKQMYDDKFIHLLGFHSIVSFFWLLIGLRRTLKPYYRTGAITFFCFTLVYVFYLILS